MYTSEKNTVAAAVTQEEPEPPSENKHLGHHGRSNKSPLRRVLVYDCERKTVQVQSEKHVCQWFPSNRARMELRNATVSDPRSYQIVKLPPKRTQVTIFVDPETESKPTTENTAPDGRSNVLFIQLHLDHLGAFHQVLRSLGLLSTLYVMNATPGSETSSTVHSHDGAG